MKGNIAPKRPETRQQRSARISSEIAMLQKGPPPSTSKASAGDSTGPGSATGTFHAPPAPPGRDAGFLETPNEMGGPESTMGENVSAGREGPNAQGAGRPLRTEQDTMGGLEANPGHHQEWVRRSRQVEEEVDVEEESGVLPKDAPIKPTTLQRDDLLHSGSGVSTIAGGNFEGVIRDRIKAAGFPHSPVARPMKFRTARMNDVLKEQIVKRLVRGVYDKRDVFAGDKLNKHRALNDVARMTLLNGSCSSSDGEKLLEKVRSLLPVPAVGQKGKRPQQVKK